MLNLYPQPVYYTGEFQALQIVVHAVFGTVA